MKVCILCLAIFYSITSFGAVVSSQDSSNDCTLYRVTTDATPTTQNEEVVVAKEAYGLSFANLSIDFENKSVTVDPMMNIVLGINRPLLTSKITIAANNPDFEFLINQVNRKIFLFEKLCVSKNNELIYARMFETK